MRCSTPQKLHLDIIPFDHCAKLTDLLIQEQLVLLRIHCDRRAAIMMMMLKILTLGA